MYTNIELENESNINSVNSELGNEISDTIVSLIFQYYSENEKIVTRASKNYYAMGGNLDDKKGRVTDEEYSRVFIKEKDIINIFSERENGTEKTVITLPNGRVDRTEATYDIVGNERVMVNFSVYYENGQTYNLYLQSGNERPQVVAELFKFLTDDSHYL